jgi:polyisoprenoid-binding protein YceI
MKRLVLAAALSLAAASVLAAPSTYVIDATHTDVVASWNHLGFSNPVAHFGQVDGTIVYDPDNVAASSVEVTIPLAGLNSHVPKLDEHMRAADFFDAAKYPEISFRSTRVDSAGEGRLRVTGDLTVRDTTRPAVLDVTINKVGEHPMAKRPAAGFDATTTLKRSEFGIGKLVPAVSDDITIRITTEAVAPAAASAG